MKRTLISLSILLASNVCLAAEIESADGKNKRESAPAEEPFWAPDAALSLTFMTDNRFRGISSTDARPGMSAVVEAFTGPFYLGTMWLNTDYGTADPNTAEWDFWIGARPSWNNLRFDFNATYVYVTPEESGNYLEYKAGVEADLFDGVAIGLNYYYSPDWRDLGVRENVLESTAKYKFDDHWSASALVGKTFLSGDVIDDWTYWNAGVSYNLTPEVKLDLRYHDTDIPSSSCITSSACSGRLIFSFNVATTVRQLLSASE